MRGKRSVSYILLWFAVSWPQASAAAAPRQASHATLFEGARLIVGDASAPIASSAFLVEDDVFTRVGRQGEIPLPVGAARVDLSGKTVMPALVNVHGHVILAVTGFRFGRIASTAQVRNNDGVI